MLKTNWHFCTSLTMQIFLKSWSLALDQPWDFSRRCKRGEFHGDANAVSNLALIGSPRLGHKFCTDRLRTESGWLQTPAAMVADPCCYEVSIIFLILDSCRNIQDNSYLVCVHLWNILLHTILLQRVQTTIWWHWKVAYALHEQNITVARY